MRNSLERENEKNDSDGHKEVKHYSNGNSANSTKHKKEDQGQDRSIGQNSRNPIKISSNKKEADKKNDHVRSSQDNKKVPNNHSAQQQSKPTTPSHTTSSSNKHTMNKPPVRL